MTANEIKLLEDQGWSYSELRETWSRIENGKQVWYNEPIPNSDDNPYLVHCPDGSRYVGDAY